MGIIDKIKDLPEISLEGRQDQDGRMKTKEMFKCFLEDFFETDEGKEFFNLLYLHLKDAMLKESKRLGAIERAIEELKLVKANGSYALDLYIERRLKFLKTERAKR